MTLGWYFPRKFRETHTAVPVFILLLLWEEVPFVLSGVLHTVLLTPPRTKLNYSMVPQKDFGFLRGGARVKAAVSWLGFILFTQQENT